MQTNLFGDVHATRGAPRWRCLPCPGTYPAAKVPMAVPPPPKKGFREVVLFDGFAGGGGASNGIESAMDTLFKQGVLPSGHPLHVTYAANHDEPAIIMHRINHRRTIHLKANVWQVSMRERLGDNFFGLLWISPDCRDHSPAKGGPITSRAVRDLAWVVIKWLKELPDWQRPWCIFLENVPAFAKWSPLIDRPDGKGLMRDPDRLGWTFHQFVHALSRFGYSIGWEEVVACEYGDPTIRKRLKLVARRDGLPIVWPEPTHAEPKSEAVQSGKLLPWPVAADIIDWSQDCPSIFFNKEEAREYKKRTGKRIIRPLAVKTNARLAIGVKRRVLDAGDDAFIVTCNHGGDGFRGQDLQQPLATVTRARDAHGLVVPHMMTMRNSGTPTSAVTDPTRTLMADGANQFVVETAISPFVSCGQHGGGNRPILTPVHTIAASDGDQNQLAAVYLAQHNGGPRAPIGRPVSKPLSTAMLEGSQQQLVAASMLSLKGSDRRDGSCENAHPSICAKGQHSAVVTLPLMTAYYSNVDGDGSQDYSIERPLGAATTKARFGLAEVEATAPMLFTEAQWARARQVAEFMREHGCWDGGEIVTLTIRGVVYVIVDIGMRMLTPRELARAQGFPDSYVLDPIYKGKPLSETEQRHKIGNSVCERPAAAVIVANYRPPLEWGFEDTPFLEAAE